MTTCLACGVNAKCIYIVSGDKDLLDLKQYDGVKIVTVNDFCQMLDSSNESKKKINSNLWRANKRI